VPLPGFDIEALPLVLAGPIVRRVALDSTTVWIALKSARKVTLEVWAGESAGAGADKKQEGTRNTAALGAHLHVVAVTATGAELAPGAIHRYTLRFGPPGPSSSPVPPTGQGLFDDQVVAARGADARSLLLYTDAPGAPALPSFITPPASAAALRLIHASCRKPHAEGRDALPILDEILHADVAAADRRPHQLVLTGDQIYADDVADVLLQLCMTRGSALLGRDEVLPGLPNQQQRMRPGRRQQDMADRFHLTSEYAKSHLVTFAEFACMYLLVWAETLWPPRILDGFRDIFPDEAARLGEPKGDMLLGLLVPKSWTRAHEKLLRFVEECDRLEVFRAGLSATRRALANTATYMMFDDHEITDDWYITERWVREVTGAPLGRRLLSNGLAAYAVFQAWGNTPERFAETGAAGERGRAILTALSAADPAAEPHASELERRLGLPTGIAAGVPQRPDGAIDWHYRVRFPAHDLVVLDTRTRRRFPNGPEDPPALILGDDDYTAMVPADAGPEVATIIVSPAPVIGYPLLESKVQPAYRAIEDYEGLLAADGEAWGHQSAAFEKFIARLVTAGPPGSDGVRRRRAILLSGDVHYAFTASLSYRAAKPFSAPAGRAEGVLAQLVSSSLHNQESGKTVQLHNHGILAGIVGGLDEERAGWENPGGGSLKVGEEWVPRGDRDQRVEHFVRGHPAVVTLDDGRSIGTPEWRYDIKFFRHTDADAPAPRPGAPVPVAYPLQDRAQAIAQYVAAADNHDGYRGRWGNGKDIVGVNNLGEVQLRWPAGDEKAVVHTLWWRLSTTPAAAPLTRCVVPLKIGQVDDPLYGGLDLREGDHDAPAGGTPVYVGTARPDLAGKTHVRDLQRDLRALGIAMDSADDGVFGRHTRWAVRELQGYAGMTGVAREEPTPTTTLAAALTAAATTMTVSATAGLAASPTLTRIGVEDELMSVTAGWGTTTWTVQRGAHGTTAATHPKDAEVRHLDRWSARLVPAPNPLRYEGHVSGLVNARTRGVISRWKRERIRCPVVVEAWTMAAGARSGLHTIPAAGGLPARPAENIWRHDEISTAPRIFVRDLSDHWERPATRPADGPEDAALSVLGTRTNYRDPQAAAGDALGDLNGGVAYPWSGHCWAPEAEILPERLCGAALTALDADTLSTYKVVRAVAEVEALGYFDAVNCYDHAFASLGLCHWTAGTRVWHPATEAARPARELWDVQNGELWAFLAYLRSRDAAAFARIAGDFGVAPDRAWVGDGKGGNPSPWYGPERKYVGRGTLADDAGARQAMNGVPPGYGQFGEHEYLRSWHWFHRFSMMGRSSAAFWQAEWNMARMRIRDILDADWNNTAVPVAQRFPLDAGTTVRQVFRSERTVALIYRWHIFSPARVVEGNQGGASRHLHAILTAANNAGPAFGTNPGVWLDAHERALATAIIDANPCPNHPANHEHTPVRDPGHTLRLVDDWPTWSAADNPRHYTLPVASLAAAERELKLTRGSFRFDSDGLP
jgi:hypothetical protein